MTANNGMVRTESQKKISYGKPTLQLTVKCHIEKFETLMDSYKPGEDLWSEGVSSELAPCAIWKLRVYPNGVTEQYKGCISIYLRLTGPMKDNKETLEATYHLYFVDGSGKADSILRFTKTFGTEYYGQGKHVSHDQAKKALQADGSLLVAAEVDFLPPGDSGAKVISESALHNDEVQQRWGVKFSELFGDQASSDCTIEIGGVSIPAHKSILIPHSPIFRAMFTNPLAEEFQSGTIKITDLQEPEPMRAVVRYCYMGHLDDATMDGEGAVEIFKLADRYCITGLKALLEQHFANKRLSVANVVVMTVLADSYTAPKLKEACLNLIAKEWETVFDSADWKQLREADSKLTTDLAVETIRVLSKKE